MSVTPQYAYTPEQVTAAFNEIKATLFRGITAQATPKILIVAGVFVVFIGIVYLNYIEPKGSNWSDFSGRIFAALLIGVLSALAVTLLLMSKSSKVD